MSLAKLECDLTSPPILFVSAEGLTLHTMKATSVTLSSTELSRALEIVQGVVFAAPNVANQFPRKMDLALTFVPFFVCMKGEKQFAPSSLSRKMTPYDRLLVEKPLDEVPASCQILGDWANRERVLSAVFEELEQDGICASVTGDRLVSRRIAKSRRAARLAALKPAIQRALRRSGAAPILFDYGIKINDLATFYEPPARYFGIGSDKNILEESRMYAPYATFLHTSDVCKTLLPEIDVLVLSDHLKSLAQDDYLEILKTLSSQFSRMLRLVLLADVSVIFDKETEQSSMWISKVLDSLAQGLGGIPNLTGMQLFGYQPANYLKGGAVIELEIIK